MSSLTRRNRIGQELLTETPDINICPQVELGAGRGPTRIPSTIAPVGGQDSPPQVTNSQGFVESTQEEETAGVMIPEENCGTMGRVAPSLELQLPKAIYVQDCLKWTPGTPVSRGRPRLRALLKTLLFISTVLWGLLKFYDYQFFVPSLSFHSLLCDKPPPSDLLPWTDLLSIENDMFDHLLKTMVAGYSMSMDVKDAQVKLADLRTLIRASGRSQKDLLVNDLSALLSEVKKSRKDLQTFAMNIGQSLERIMETNDRALRRIRRVPANQYIRRLGILKSMETSITSDFEVAMNALYKSLEVTDNDIASNSHGLRGIDEDLNWVMRSLMRSSDERPRDPSSKVDEPSTKQFERYLQGLRDLESYANQASYIMGSAHTVIRDTKQQLEGIRARLIDWELVAWSALNEKDIKPIADELEKLAEKKIWVKSAQEELMTRRLQ